MVRINNVKRMPLHPAVVDFRRYGGERAKPAGDATTEKAAHRTMQGAVTPKKGTCNKRIKSFARGPAWYYPPCVAACSGQSSHGARRRARQRSAAIQRERERFPVRVIFAPRDTSIADVLASAYEPIILPDDCKIEVIGPSRPKASAPAPSRRER